MAANVNEEEEFTPALGHIVCRLYRHIENYRMRFIAN
jgi:hypothetical protein